MSNARERLLVLEAEGKFLFHGSPLLVKELIPRQPVNFDKETGEEEKDGDPCVAATHFVEIAIFRAITHRTQFSGRGCATSFGLTPEGNVRLEITRNAWKQLKGKTGYVYIFSRNEFSRHSRMEWRSEHKMKPLEVIAVSTEDLSKNIQVKQRI